MSPRNVIKLCGDVGLDAFEDLGRRIHVPLEKDRVIVLDPSQRDCFEYAVRNLLTGRALSLLASTEHGDPRRALALDLINGA